MIKLSFYRGAQFACCLFIFGLELAEPSKELQC
jgi:hypothetical protein